MKNLNVGLLLLMSLSVQAGESIQMPKNEKERLTTTNLSLTAEKVYDAYMSVNLQERRFAEMYVIGVLDSTEGSSWCDYKRVSPDALQEQAYTALSDAKKKNLNIRAAEAIKTRLNNLLPCNKQQ